MCVCVSCSAPKCGCLNEVGTGFLGTGFLATASYLRSRVVLNQAIWLFLASESSE